VLFAVGHTQIFERLEQTFQDVLSFLLLLPDVLAEQVVHLVDFFKNCVVTAFLALNHVYTFYCCLYLNLMSSMILRICVLMFWKPSSRFSFSCKTRSFNRDTLCFTSEILFARLSSYRRLFFWHSRDK
jgi:hypothetical protein